jgi:hypothetical protein
MSSPLVFYCHYGRESSIFMKFMALSYALLLNVLIKLIALLHRIREILALSLGLEDRLS